MLAVVAASCCAAAVVVLAVGWVRPVPVGAGLPRRLGGRTGHRVRGWGCPAWFAAAARRADLPEPLQRWWCGAVGGVVWLGAAGLALGGPVLGTVASAMTMAGFVAGLQAGRSRLDRRLGVSVPDSLEAIARASRAGSSIPQALAGLDGPDAGVADRLFAGVAARVERGESLATALDHLVSRHPVPPVRLAVAALLVGQEAGASPARAVEGVAATLRDRAALDREAHANAAQARASVAVLLLAPIGFGVFAMATDPRVGDFLFRSWPGWVCLITACALDGLGALWMHRIMVSAR